MNPVAINVLTSRYLQKDINGVPIETIDELWQRVAKHASNIEPTEELKMLWYDRIYTMLSKQTFLFNSPTLVNAGTTINGLSACFVVGMSDSVEGIWKTKQEFAKIAQKGGGCGVNICELRPKNDPVAGSTHAKAGGPISFLETIWHDMEAMTQSGFRAMACMAVMRIDHPDIIDFIEAKSPIRALAAQLQCSVEESTIIWNTLNTTQTLTVEQEKLIQLSERYLSNFNISVGITDAFMNALSNNGSIDLVFNNKVYNTVPAQTLWNKIIENAHASGDPGLLFLDTVNNNSPYRYSGQVIKATNPCGEQGLPANGVCNLGSIDISKFVTSDGLFDIEGFEDTCTYATHALNNIVDIADWPTRTIAEWVSENRPIGLGIMGYADALLLMGIKYGSEEALQFAKVIISIMYDIAEQVSIELGIERGIPKACKKLPKPRRNVTLLSIAPTGTISLIAGCSSGCEPIFQYVQIRRDNTGTYLMIHPAIKKLLNIDDEVFPIGIDITLLQTKAQSILDKIKNISDIFVDTNDVAVVEHILTQAAFQVGHDGEKCVDSGVSKTINLPNDATHEMINAAYQLAYSVGCKGITVYRDGSKFFQILNRTNTKESSIQEDIKDYTVVDAKRYKVKYKGDRWYVIVGLNEGKPTELFTITSREDDTISTTDALNRMISLALRYGVPLTKVISQLRKVRQYNITSFPAMIARILSQYLPNESEESLICDSCHSTNVYLSGGCPICQDCGYSKCS